MRLSKLAVVTMILIVRTKMCPAKIIIPALGQQETTSSLVDDLVSSLVAPEEPRRELKYELHDALLINLLVYSGLLRKSHVHAVIK